MGLKRKLPHFQPAAAFTPKAHMSFLATGRSGLPPFVTCIAQGSQRSRRNRIGPALRVRLIVDRCVDELLHAPAVCATRLEWHLSHEHYGKLFLRIDPKERTCGATPHIFALGARHPRNARLRPDHEAKPESIAGRPENKL